MYFGHKHVETGSNCSHENATFLKYHMPLSTYGPLRIYEVSKSSYDNYSKDRNWQ